MNCHTARVGHDRMTPTENPSGVQTYLPCRPENRFGVGWNIAQTGNNQAGNNRVFAPASNLSDSWQRVRSA